MHKPNQNPTIHESVRINALQWFAVIRNIQKKWINQRSVFCSDNNLSAITSRKFYVKFPNLINHEHLRKHELFFLFCAKHALLLCVRLWVCAHACVHLQNLPTVCVSFSLKLQRTWSMFLAWRNPLPLTTTWNLSETETKNVQAP